MEKKLSIGKRMLAFVLTFAMVFTAISWGEVGGVKAEETNLLSDGDFNAVDLSAWAIEGSATAEKVTKDEENYLLLSFTSTGEATISSSTDINVTPGKTYTISGKVLQASTCDVTMYCNGESYAGDTHKVCWDATNWEDFSFTYTASSETTSFQYLFTVYGKTWDGGVAKIYLDKLSVVEKTSTGSDPVAPVYTLSLSTDAVDNAQVVKGSTLTVTAAIKKDDVTLSSLNDEDKEEVWFCEEIWHYESKGDAAIEGKDASNTFSKSITFPSVGTYYIKAEFKSNSVTSVSDVIEITVVEQTFSNEDVTNLKAKVPSDLNEFTETTANAVTTALGKVDALTGSSTQEEVQAACKELSDAIDALRYADETLQIKKVDGLADRTDFIKGIDVSTYLTLTDNGVVYKDFNGNVLADSKDFFKLFADQGVNHIRIRIWNDPKDAQGNTYGGGNNDLAMAKRLCEAINTYNEAYPTQKLKVLIDFHYSDFWVDPDKFRAPKAWEELTVNTNASIGTTSIDMVETKLASYKTGTTITNDENDKAVALAKFTVESLQEISDTGVDISMVQIGNETNNGFVGETDDDSTCVLFQAGCLAVKAFQEKNDLGKIKRVIHYTDPHKSDFQCHKAAVLAAHNVDYDVFATSFYPYWHGTTDDLGKNLSTIASTYGKEVMVAETQYIHENTDHDGAENQAFEGKDNTDLDYPVSVQGQARELRNVINAVASIPNNKGIGVYYWEPGWLAVNDVINEDGTLNEEKYELNKTSWQTAGTGWATDHAKEYDPAAEKWGGGGTNCENAALFGADGIALPSLKVFKYVNYGSVANQGLYYGYSFEQDQTTVVVGDSASQLASKLPASVTVENNKGETYLVAVTWNNLNAIATQIKAASAVGNNYTAIGTIEAQGTREVRHSIDVIPNVNLLSNGGFDDGTADGDLGAWVRTDIPNNFLYFIMSETNNKSGAHSLTFNTYTGAEDTGNPGSVYQDVTISEPGNYSVVGFAEGLDQAGKTDDEEIVIKVQMGNGTTLNSNRVVLEGWQVWKRAEVNDIVITQEMIANGQNTVRVELSCILNINSWGTWDDIFLFKKSDLISGSSGNNNQIVSGGNTDSTVNSGSDDTQKITQVTNPDGTTSETKTETTTNESGKEVETTVTTTKDADGKVTGSTEVSTIANVAKNTEVTVTVEKDADGKVAEAAAEVTKKGAETKTGTKGTIAGAVVNQIKEAAGTADIAITTSVTDAKGNEKYSVTVNAGDLVAGEKLTVVVKDEKTGKTVLVDAKQIKVTVNGGVNVVLPEGKDYTLIDTKEAEKVTKEILKTVAPVKTSATLKEGKKATAKLSKKLDMDNVKKITYVSSKKSVATVDQNGKVTAKKAGTVIISIKVTLNNGTTKTVKMKYKVK